MMLILNFEIAFSLKLDLRWRGRHTSVKARQKAVNHKFLQAHRLVRRAHHKQFGTFDSSLRVEDLPWAEVQRSADRSRMAVRD